MKIISQLLYKGANIYHKRPVACMTVGLDELINKTTVDLGADFIEGIIGYLPGLEKRAFGGEKQGDSAYRMRYGKGMLITELIWRIAVELQRKVNSPISFGTAIKTDNKNIVKIIYEYNEILFGKEAGPLALRLILNNLKNTYVETDTNLINFDFDSTRNPLGKWSPNYRLDLNSVYIVNAAAAKNIPFSRINSKICRIGQGRYSRFIRSATTEILSLIDFKLTEDKSLTVKVLDQIGIPVPRQIIVGTVTTAIKGAKHLGFPVVVKPRDSYTGLGVSTRIEDAASVEQAFHEAIKYSNRVIVEDFIEGDDHRILVVNGDFVACVKRLPAHVVADGEHTIRELVEITNNKRHAYGRRPKYDIKIDKVSELHIHKQNYSWESRPKKDETVFFRSASNYSQGGICIDVTEEVHPDNRTLAVRAALSFSMDIAGVDFITTDIGRSYKDIGGAVCEVGSRPGLLLHFEPDIGEPRDVATPIIEMLYSGEETGRILTAGICGSQHKQLSARMLAHILTVSGVSVGLFTQADIIIEGDKLGRENVKLHKALDILFNDKSVEAAIFEINLQQFVALGLGCNSCSVIGLTNINLGNFIPRYFPNEPSLFKAFAALLDVSEKQLIINVDDEVCRRLVGFLVTDNIHMISTQNRTGMVDTHIRQGGIATIIEEEEKIKSLVHYQNNKRSTLIELSSIRTNCSPKDLPRELLCVTFVSAMSLTMGINIESISYGLKTLVTRNPEKIKVLTCYPFTVILADSYSNEAIERSIMIAATITVNCKKVILFDSMYPFDHNRQGGLNSRCENVFQDIILTGEVTRYASENSSSELFDNHKNVSLISSEFDAISQAFTEAKAGDVVVLISRRFNLLKKQLSTSTESLYGSLIKKAQTAPQSDNLPKKKNLPAFASKLPAPEGERLWTADELAIALKGKWINHPGKDWYASGVTYFIWALRKGDLIITTNPDQWPNKYDDLQDKIEDMFKKGASAAVVSRVPSTYQTQYPLLVVDNTRAALDHIGKAARDRFSGRMIGITGSVGKTTTTEMVCFLLSQQAKTHSTVHNFNSTPGVPLSLSRTPKDAKYAVIELGIGKSHRANYLRARMMRPHVALITTIQPDHLEFYGSMEGIVDAKCDLFKGLQKNGTVILNRDAPLYERQLFYANQQQVNKIITFGRNEESNFRIISFNLFSDKSNIVLSVFGKTIQMMVPHPGRHMIYNAIAALACVYAVGADWEKAVHDMENIPKVAGRTDIYTVPMKGGNYILIDDAYSANPGSITSSLELLRLIPLKGKGRYIVVLGEMRELGDATEELHAGLREPILSSRVDKVYLIGDSMKILWDNLPTSIKGAHENRADKIVAMVQNDLKPDDIILVKGSARTAGAMKEVLNYLKVNAEPYIASETSYECETVPILSAPVPTKKKIDIHVISDVTIETQKKETSIMFVGDTGFGENYQEARAKKGEENILKSRGYNYPLAKINSLLQKPEMVLANLETPLTDLTESPFINMKSWVHRGDKKQTTDCLLHHNIKFVTLANNHSFDYGQAGFRETIEALDISGIKYVGAGLDDKTSRQPLLLEFPVKDGRNERLAIFAAYQWSRKAQEQFDLFSGNGKGGINPMHTENLKNKISKLRKEDSDITIIVCPHWGQNYQWASPFQKETAGILLNAGADLIIGHGAHMMQELEKIGNKWAVFGLGNFMFNSPGRYAKFKAPPFSFVAELIFKPGNNKTLRLYPIVTDNQITNYQTRCVSAKEFQQVCEHLKTKNNQLFQELQSTTILIDGKNRHCFVLDILTH